MRASAGSRKLATSSRKLPANRRGHGGQVRRREASGGPLWYDPPAATRSGPGPGTAGRPAPRGVWRLVLPALVVLRPPPPTPTRPHAPQGEGVRSARSTLNGRPASPWPPPPAPRGGGLGWGAPRRP